MPTIKLQNGGIVLKNGKVSCQCCEDEDEEEILPTPCQQSMPPVLFTHEISSEAALSAYNNGLDVALSFSMPSLQISEGFNATANYLHTATIATSVGGLNLIRKNADCNFAVGYQNVYGGAGLRQFFASGWLIFQNTGSTIIGTSVVLYLRQVEESFVIGVNWNGGLTPVGAGASISTGNDGPIGGSASGTATIIDSEPISFSVPLYLQSNNGSSGGSNGTVSIFVALRAP